MGSGNGANEVLPAAPLAEPHSIPTSGRPRRRVDTSRAETQNAPRSLLQKTHSTITSAVLDRLLQHAETLVIEGTSL